MSEAQLSTTFKHVDPQEDNSMKVLIAVFLPNRRRASRPIPGPLTYERDAKGLVDKTHSKDRPR